MIKFYQLKQFLLIVLLIVTVPVMAQQVTVTGTVKAEDDGTPLPGVSVVEKGTANGTVTDADGNYSINVGDNATLIFSFVGFNTSEVPVQGRSSISINLATDVQTLQEVVVVGYGTQTKREITGSIAKVDGSKLLQTTTPSFESALQGRAAGVQVIQGSGVAGSGAVIRIRGISSVSASADPLYVVDGIPITADQFINGNAGAQNTNPLASINPNDIESIEILKDASAAGIYGSRGSNGVVLITTKRGKSGKPTFNFDTKIGFSQPTAKAKMLNSAQYLQLYQEAYENDGGVGQAPLPNGISWEDARQTDTDWWDLVTQTGFKHEYNLSMSQGNSKLKSYVGLSYSDQESYLVGNSYERLSGRANIDYNLTDKLSFALSTSLARGNNIRVATGWTGGLGSAMSTALPIYPVTNPDGTYWTNGSNPVADIRLKDWRVIDTRTINNLYVTYKPLRNLQIRAGGGIDYLDSKDDTYQTGQALNVEHAGTGTQNLTWITNMSYSGTAEYDFADFLPSKHKLKLMIGTEYQQSSTSGITGKSKTDISEPLYKDPTMGEDGIETAGNRKSRELFRFISYFSRINYSLLDRYIAQVSFRGDGSSKFGPNNRFGYFPTLALGWIASEESFLKSNSLLSFLKLKASVGLTGNSNFENFQWIDSYELRPLPGGYNGQPMLFPQRFANPDLKWEQTLNFDAGFEIGFLDDRITAELAYYEKHTEGALMRVALPGQIGLGGNYFDNVGDIVNKGIEFSFTSRNLVGEFKWTTDFNISRNTNEVNSIGSFAAESVSGGTNDTRIIIGEPIGTNFLVRFSRLDPATGRPIYLDKNGFDTYTWDPANRVAVGNILPDFTGGITNTFGYKGFDFSFLITFTKGGDIFDSSSKRQLGVVTDWNMREDLFDRWRQPGDNATYPVLTQKTDTYGSGTPWINTDLWLHDGSYARVRNVSLGYTFSGDMIEKIKLRNARIFLTATNILTFTKYPGLDPEIARDFENVTDRNMSPNITYLSPPQEKSISIGINIGF